MEIILERTGFSPSPSLSHFVPAIANRPGGEELFLDTAPDYIKIKREAYVRCNYINFKRETYVRCEGPNSNSQDGEGGIRTPGECYPTTVFKTAALNHSATSPTKPYAHF